MTLHISLQCVAFPRLLLNIESFPLKVRCQMAVRCANNNSSTTCWRWCWIRPSRDTQWWISAAEGYVRWHFRKSLGLFSVFFRDSACVSVKHLLSWYNLGTSSCYSVHTYKPWRYSSRAAGQYSYVFFVSTLWSYELFFHILFLCLFSQGHVGIVLAYMLPKCQVRLSDLFKCSEFWVNAVKEKKLNLSSSLVSSFVDTGKMPHLLFFSFFLSKTWWTTVMHY